MALSRTAVAGACIPDALASEISDITGVGNLSLTLYINRKVFSIPEDRFACRTVLWAQTYHAGSQPPYAAAFL